MAGTAKRLRLPRAAILRKRSDIEQVRRRGAQSGGRYMRVFVWFHPEITPPMIGIITSRKVGPAVRRNHVRRRLREILRLSRPAMRPGARVVVTARPPSAEASSAELRAEWLRLAEKLSIFASAS